MGRSPTYSKKAVIKALKNTGGIVRNAAEALGCNRQTIYNAMERWPEVAEAREQEVETLIDFAEEKLIEQIAQGNMTAICFFLKCRAKDRGYVERQQHEISGRDGGPVELTAIPAAQLLDRARTLAARISEAAEDTEDDG